MMGNTGGLCNFVLLWEIQLIRLLLKYLPWLVLRTFFGFQLTWVFRRLRQLMTILSGSDYLLLLEAAFGAFGTGGFRQEPIALLKVEDTKGKVLFEHKAVQPRRVLSADVAFIISHILSDNNARKDVFGEKSYLVIPGKTVAVKTGTTDDKRDNWTIGYSPSVVVGVWVGNNDNSPMNPALASGVTGAAPIWNRIIREALIEKKDEPFTKPDNVIEMDVDSYAGGTPVTDARRKEFFIKGTEPNGQAACYQNIKISKHDGNKLANVVEILKGEYETKQYVVWKEQDPVSGDGKNRWQDGINAWIAGQGDSKFHPPTETYSGGDSLGISIKEPGNESQINDNNVKITIKAVSPNGISKIEVFVDGVKKKEVGSDNFSDTVSIPINGPYYTIKAKATDSKGNSTESEIHIGVNMAYATPTPVPTATPIPTSTPLPTPIP